MVTRAEDTLAPRRLMARNQDHRYRTVFHARGTINNSDQLLGSSQAASSCHGLTTHITEASVYQRGLCHPIPTMISATRRWLRRNRTNFAIGAGVLGAGYVVGQYVLSKIAEARERMSNDRIAREKYALPIYSLDLQHRTRY